MSTLVRKILTGVVAAASIGAMVVASSAPAAAWGYGPHPHWGGGGIAAGVLGGLAVGAIAAGAAGAYGPYYGPACGLQRQTFYDYNGYAHTRLVRVCD